GAVGPCCPGVWGAVVNFERVGKKGQDGTGQDDDGDDGLGSSSSDTEGGSSSDSSSSSSSDDSSDGADKAKGEGRKGGKRSKGGSKKSRKKSKGSKKGDKKRGKKGRGKGGGGAGDAAAVQKATAKRAKQMAKWVVDVLVQGEEGWNGTTLAPPLPAPSPPGGPGAAGPVAGAGSAPLHRLRVVPAQTKGWPHVVTFPLSQVDRLSSVRIYIHKDLRPLEARQAGVRAVGEAVARLVSSQGRVPLLDPEEDLRIESREVRKLVSKLEGVEAQLLAHPLAREEGGRLQARLAAAQQAVVLEQAVQAAKREARAAASLVLKEDLRARLRVLRRLGYVDKEGVVSLKGRVAAGIQLSADELVLCELCFSGAFNTLSVEVLAALLSCFVWREKSEKKPARALACPLLLVGLQLREVLLPPLGSLKEAARRVARVSVECQLEGFRDPEEYVETFRTDLMEPVAAWVRGVRFMDLTKMTSIFEGSLVRAVRRLEELMRQMAEALAGVGDTTLSEKFATAGLASELDRCRLTVVRGFRIAITAAMKNVLSPISLIRILEEEAASVSQQEWGTRKQLVVFFGNAGIGTRGKVVTVDEFRTNRVSSILNSPQPCEEELDSSKPTRPKGWKPKPGQVQDRLLRSAWSKRFEAPVRGLMW
ncbi:hypothetical protein QJQ45_014979, partial [Haematococcus lacustris]